VREPVVKPSLLVSVFGAVVVAIVYFVAARLSLALLEKPDGVAVFWPAAGVASGVLIGFGAGARWPVVAGVMAATLGANLLGDRNLPSTLFFAAANAGEAVLVAGLIQWIYGAPFDLNDLRRVLGLFVATIVGTSGGLRGLRMPYLPAKPAVDTRACHRLAQSPVRLDSCALAAGLYRCGDIHLGYHHRFDDHICRRHFW
jgi:MASE1 protein